MHKANTEKLVVIFFFNLFYFFPFFFLLRNNSSEYISFYEPKIGLEKITSILGRCDFCSHQ